MRELTWNRDSAGKGELLSPNNGKWLDKNPISYGTACRWERVKRCITEGGGAPGWVQPTCGTSLGSRGSSSCWRILRREAKPRRKTPENFLLLSPRSAPCPGSPGTGGCKTGPVCRVTRQLNPTASINGGKTLWRGDKPGLALWLCLGEVGRAGSLP